MRRSRFTEEPIISILKEHEAGVPVSDLCRKHGVSDASIYKWKVRFGGMEVSEAKRLRALEDENAKLKRMLADAMLDNVALKPQTKWLPENPLRFNAAAHSALRPGNLHFQCDLMVGHKLQCPHQCRMIPSRAAIS